MEYAQIPGTHTLISGTDWAKQSATERIKPMECGGIADPGDVSQVDPGDAPRRQTLTVFDMEVDMVVFHGEADMRIEVVGQPAGVAGRAGDDILDRLPDQVEPAIDDVPARDRINNRTIIVTPTQSIRINRELPELLPQTPPTTGARSRPDRSRTHDPAPFHASQLRRPPSLRKPTARPGKPGTAG